MEVGVRELTLLTRIKHCMEEGRKPTTKDLTLQHSHFFHVTMEISVHSVENIPRYTADTVGRVTISYTIWLCTHT